MMALNLWKLGGKPTSYDTLVGHTTYADIGLGVYLLTFKAKSESNGVIRVTNSTGSSKLIVNLTNEYKVYSGEFSTIGQGTPRCYLQDLNGSNDIAIKDIQLIEKPLGKLTDNKTSKRQLPSRKGLVMDGNTYIQLPSLTMDSIEIDCLIDSVQPNSSRYIIDARSGLINGYVFESNGNLIVGSTIKSVDGYKKGERTTVKIKTDAPFTDDVTIFEHFLIRNEKTKGIIYKIKCYLNGNVVWESDFTKPHEGNILHNGGEPVNLLPSFDSGEWNLHPNAKVLGKDVLELVASGSYQHSTIDVYNVQPKKYILSFNSGNPHHLIRYYNQDNTAIGELAFITVLSRELDVPTGTHYIRIFLSSSGSGTLTFQQPKLIKVGQTGSIVGNVSPQVKKAKRTLYAKR